MMGISGFIFADIAYHIQLQNQSQMLKLMEVWEYFPPTKEDMGKGTCCQGVKENRTGMEGGIRKKVERFLTWKTV